MSGEKSDRSRLAAANEPRAGNRIIIIDNRQEARAPRDHLLSSTPGLRLRLAQKGLVCLFVRWLALLSNMNGMP